jgi:hypothetical protein
VKSLLGSALLTAVIMSSSTAAFANAATCIDLFKAVSVQSAAVRAVVIEDGYKQWMLWEQTANMKMFRKQAEPVNVGLVEMSPENVIVRSTPDAPAALMNQFRTVDGNIYWPKHPYNNHPGVPFKDLPADEQLPVYLTASRSLALDGKLRGFTIKLATNYPHGPNGQRQDGKIETNDDIDSALIHTNHMNKVDHVMGPDEKVLTLGEVMTMAEKKTGIGMVVRDVRLLADGNYYLPALSIPYVGREIAALNGVPFDEFFKTNYAELLGEAKARMLLRYGLQMLTPNSQNMLIQFDRNMKPTGKIVFRDVSDAYLVDAVAKGLGYSGQIKRDNAVEYPPKTEIKPFWSNSSWMFDEAGEGKAVSETTIDQWGLAHNRAYIKYIEKELGMNFNVAEGMLGADSFAGVYQMLSTDIGQKKLRQYRDRMIEAEKVLRRTQDAAAQAG